MLMSKVSSKEEYVWHLEKTLEHGWSVDDLTCLIPHLIDIQNEWYNLSSRVRRKDYGTDVQYRIQGRSM